MWNSECWFVCNESQVLQILKCFCIQVFSLIKYPAELVFIVKLCWISCVAMLHVIPILMVDLSTDKMQALFTEYSFKVMFSNIFVIKYAILFYFAFLNTCYLWLFFLFAHWSFKVRLATYKWKAQVGGQANDTFTLTGLRSLYPPNHE